MRHRGPSLLAGLVTLALLFPGDARRARGQGLGAAPPTRASLTARADSLYLRGDAAQALELLEAQLEENPEDYELRWKAARVTVSIGLLQPSEPEQNRWYERGMAHGQEAVRLRPDGIDGLFWLTANQGRLAIQLPPRASAAAALEVYQRAHRILALDSLHAGANNALGKIDYEVMRLTRVERLLARTFTGNEAFRRASWAGAEARQRRAVELDPDMPLFHLDLGRTYLYTGRYEQAVRELETALALPDRHPGDALYKQEARIALDFARRRRTP